MMFSGTISLYAHVQRTNNIVRYHIRVSKSNIVQAEWRKEEESSDR